MNIATVNIENIVKFIPGNENIYPNILELDVGIILICTSYPLGTSVWAISSSRRTNILRKYPCVILQSCLKDGYSLKLLVAPLVYGLVPDIIFDIRFKNLELDDDFIKCAYIQIGKMGYVWQEDLENILGQMPDNYMNDALKLLEKLKPIIGMEDIE